MGTFRKVVLVTVLLVVTSLVEAQKKKYTDENRPYEFGFKIDGEQHRHEKKDEEGIIMGEFGFITGDGIYHVTVFATDENGNYKILSMKHIRVGPSPWGPAKQATTTTTTTTTTTPAPTTSTPRSIFQGKPGCSNCVIPTTPDPSRPAPPGGFPGTRPGSQSGAPGSRPGSPGKFPGSPGSPGSPGPFPGSPGKFPGSSGSPGQFPGSPGSPGQFPGSTGSPGKFPGSSGSSGQFPGSPGSPGKLPGSPVSPGQFPGSQGSRPVSPPGGSSPGLPPGVTVDDVMGLLYKFNYTVGYHGHNEQGYRNGDKDGEYHASFRDGLKRIVTYIADGNGYQPKVKFVRLDDKDTPRAETEKEAGLKGYEFKWFNRR